MISSRVKKSVAWHANDSPASPPNPVGFIEMDNAENWLIRPEVLPTVKAAIQRDFSVDDLDYQRNLPGYPKLLQGTASFFNKFFSPRTPVLPEQVVTQRGAMEILDSLIYTICDDNEGLLIDAPFWSGFGNAAHLRNSDRFIEVQRPSLSGHPDEIIKQYEKAMEDAPCPVRGIIVCNPHNPFGHIYPTSYMEAVLRFCESHDIHYISDEIYGLSTWSGPNQASLESNPDIVESPEKKFTSVLSLDLKELKVNPARVHVIYGISKDFGCSGLRLGILVTQNNPDLHEAVYTVSRYTVSSATAIIATAMFSDLLLTEHWLVKSRMLLRMSADYVGGFMTFHNIPFYRPVAGVFVFARLGGCSATKESDAALWKRISAAGAALAYGAAFHEIELGWFRITFALPKKQLVEGLRRVETGLGTKRRYWGDAGLKAMLGAEISPHPQPNLYGIDDSFHNALLSVD